MIRVFAWRTIFREKEKFRNALLIHLVENTRVQSGEILTKTCTICIRDEHSPCENIGN